MGVYNATVITNAGQNLIASAIAGGQAINFTAVKTSTHVYPAGTALQNLTSLSDVKQTVAPTSVDVYNNNVVQISARVSNFQVTTAYLINTIGLFGKVGSGEETLVAVLTAITPDEMPVFDSDSPSAFIFNIQMTIQNANEIVFEVNDAGTATVADLNRLAQPFTGCTETANGTSGMVPQPSANFQNRFLSGAALWEEPATMIENFSSSDVSDSDSVTEWTAVDKLATGEDHHTIMGKISKMFKNIRYLRKNGIKNITRNGTTFTATRLDGSTFTFDQQDNNTTYGLATTSAAGLLRQLNGNTSQYMRGDGTWQTPPNTWRGIQNVLTSTSTTESLSAAMGKQLKDQIGNLGVTGGSDPFYRFALPGGIYLIYGARIYSNINITSAYGNAYFYNFTCSLNGLVPNNVLMAQATALCNGGVYSVSFATANKSQLTGFIWSPSKETGRNVSLNLFVVCN